MVFCGLSYADTDRILGLESYLTRYGSVEAGGADLRQHMHEFEDWKLTVPFGPRSLDVLCCPEDKECPDSACPMYSVCLHCRLPVCTECEGYISDVAPSMPPASLANDMMVFYAPTELYAE